MNRLFLTTLSILAASFIATGQTVSVTLEPIADNTIFSENPGELSNGSGDFLFSGTTDDGHLRRALLKFDLSNIPQEAIIDSASLSLSVSKSIAGAMDAYLHTLTSDWGEGNSNAAGQEGKGASALSGDATWIHTFYDTDNWNAAGGDYVSEPVATATFGNSGLAAFKSAELNANLNDWIANPAENYGWIIIVNESIKPSAKRFYSREYVTDENKRPKLVLHYETVTSIGNLSEKINAIHISVNSEENSIYVDHSLPGATYRLSIYDITGAMVSEKDIYLETGKNRILQTLPGNALYLLKLKGKQGIFTGKVMF